MDNKKMSKTGIAVWLILSFLWLNMLFVGYGKIQGSIMIDAIRENDIEKLESILKFANPNTIPGAVVIDAISQNIGEDNQTPLGAACDVGNFQMVKLLVEDGADVNYVPKNAFTSPLNIAVQSDSVDNLKIVKFLIEKGADIHYPNYKNDQPAYNVMKERELPPNGMEILKELMGVGADPENELLLQVACLMKHEEAIRYLVEEWGYDASDPYYLCAYCYGGGEYSCETFEYFFARGANPYQKGKYDKSAIELLGENSPEWAEKLIELAAKHGITE